MDLDCAQQSCPTCRENETCVQVLAIPELTLGVGESLDLFVKSATLKNLLPDDARIKETWNADIFNISNDPSATLRYRIRGPR